MKLTVAVVLQFALIGFVHLAPIGFDTPSEWGLDYGHFLMAAVAYLVLLIFGIVEATLGRRWAWIPFQVIVGVAGIVAVR